MVMEMGSSGAGVNGWGGAATVVTFPVTPAGDVSTSPVRYTSTTPPRAAGLDGELVLPSELAMAPGPVPEELAVNKPGEVVTTFTNTPLELWPRNFNTTLALTNCLI